MNEPKMISERDAVLREREAFVAGVVAVHRARNFGSDAVAMAFVSCDQADTAEGIAAKQYPLPKVKQPRVVADPHKDFGQGWRVRDGKIQWCSWLETREVHGSWHDFAPQAMGKTTETPTSIQHVTNERIKLWADLLANPTETVEADS